MPQSSLSDTGPSVASAALDKAEVSSRHPRRGSYPPVSSVPPTSPVRLSQAAEDADSDQAPLETVLYLAYGSNMSVETFLGVRGIRPLSQVNVSVPVLQLTFDLPGVPYWEPCFANVGFRKPSHKPSPVDPLGEEWDGRLVGVVYEVTLKDWRTIMRTEGAGSSYKEIVVLCFPIHPELASHGAPKPILARTLYASYDGSGRCGWWHRLTVGRRRPEPGHAQASARYLKLLKDGGREHHLPETYQRYLASLQPYTITCWRQTAGRFLFLGMWAPLLIFFLKMTALLADETGKLPRWLAGGVTMMFNLMWMSYDVIFKPVFGDGEGTEAEGGGKNPHERDLKPEEASPLANGKGS